VTPRPAPAVRGLWRYRLDRRRAITGGATSEGGNVFAWCRSVLRLSDEVSVESALASASAGEHGLTILPFLAGERAPGWRDGRRAVLAGLTLDTTAADILRAALEAVALRLALVYGLLGPLAAPDHRVVASGAALARSPGWARIIADALGRPLELCAEEEATSRGAALLALEALGSIRDVGEVPAPIRAVVEPDLERHALLQQALARQQEFDARLG
jgi:gluconokinase